MSNYLTTTEIADIFKVSERTIMRWAKSGMPHIKIERTTRFDVKEVEDWVKREKAVQN